MCAESLPAKAALQKGLVIMTSYFDASIGDEQQLRVALSKGSMTLGVFRLALSSSSLLNCFLLTPYLLPIRTDRAFSSPLWIRSRTVLFVIPRSGKIFLKGGRIAQIFFGHGVCYTLRITHSLLYSLRPLPMGEMKPKRPVRRRVIKAENSPEPMGPVGGLASDMATGSMCGHSECGDQCGVRYVGPTSSLRDHHIVHAARGVTHVWTAAVITGFAIVLTGAIAFNAAQASMEKKIDDGQANVKSDVTMEVRRLSAKIDAMDTLVRKMARQCLSTGGTTSTSSLPSDPAPAIPR